MEKMNLADVTEKITGFFNRIKKLLVNCGSHALTIFKGLWANVPKPSIQREKTVQPRRKPGPSRAGSFGSFTDWFRRHFGPGSIQTGKKKAVIFGVAGFAALFLILIIAILALNIGRSRESSANNLAAGPAIPSEDLFIPAEPDFLPQFLLEREPRRFWSIDDIRLYWKNPGDPDHWRGEIKSFVDKLMEGVP